jgi:rhamnosyltransferase subunit B
MQQSVMAGKKHRAALNQTPNPLVIIATSGTSGDILPFITLSQGLLERGHRVLMLVPRFHEAIVQAAGVPYQTIGAHEEFQALLNDPDLWDERKGWGVIWNGLVPHLGALRQLIQRLPVEETCVVLSHPILIPMAAMARAVRPNLRIIAAYLAPSNLCSSHDMLSAGSLRIPDWIPISWRQTLWKLIHKGWIDPATLPSLNSAREQSGLPTVPHFFEHMLTAPSASLGLFPSWYACVQPDWPKSFSDGDFVSATLQSQTTLSPELEQFLSNGSPPIVFTPGTGHQHAERYFNIALKTLMRLGRRGIFVTPHAAQLPDSLPSSVMWQSHVPFALLLPRAAAVVHHGGIGTTAEAFRTGTPQLIVPFAYDQFDNGLRAKRLGVADVLLAKRLSVRRMQRKLAHILISHDVIRACSTIAQKMAQKSNMPWLLDRIEAALFEINPIKSDLIHDCAGSPLPQIDGAREKPC